MGARATPRGRAALVTFATLGVGCGGRTLAVPNENVPVTFASGSRLHAYVYSSEDGSVRRFGGFHDTLEDVDCTFTQETATRFRCVPGAFAGPEYANQSCTIPLVTVSDCWKTLPRYATYSDVGPCGDAPILQVFELGARTTVDTAFERDISGACLEVGPHPHPSAAVMPVDLSRFVAADLVVEHAGKDVGVATLRAEDGARQIYWLEELSRKAQCTPTIRNDLRGDDSTYCVDAMEGENYESVFTGADCAAGSLYHAVDACPKTFVARREGTDPCRRGVFIDAVAEELTPSQVHVKSRNGCAVEQAAPDGHYYATHPAPAGAFPRVETSIRGDGPLRLQIVSRDGEPLTAKPVLADGTACVPRRVVGETDYRCLPIGNGTYNAYVDAACTTHAYEVASLCGATASGLVTVFSDVACAGAVDVFRIGGPVPGTIYAKRGSACSVSSPVENLTFFGLDRVPPETFPKLLFGPE